MNDTNISPIALFFPWHFYIIVKAMTQVKHFLKTKFACCPRECIECLKKLLTLRAIEGGEKNRAENDKKKVTQMRKVSRKD